MVNQNIYLIEQETEGVPNGAPSLLSECGLSLRNRKYM